MGDGGVRRPVAHYDASYANFSSRVLAEVRAEAFGEDIGQNGWLTADEYRRFLGWLNIGPEAHLLDVGSGSGGPALFVATTTGCRVTGVDVNEAGVANGNRLARERGLDGRVAFLVADGGAPLPFGDGAFDAVVCIDAINHLPDRRRVLGEWSRVLRWGGRLLFTDPITLTGILTSEEIAIRSSIGYFLYAPKGVDEELLEAAGLGLLRSEDLTEAVAVVAGRWHTARERRRDDLLRAEGAETYEGQQRFFEVARRLAAERRLSRYAFLAEKRR